MRRLAEDQKDVRRKYGRSDFKSEILLVHPISNRKSFQSVLGPRFHPVLKSVLSDRIASAHFYAGVCFHLALTRVSSDEIGSDLPHSADRPARKDRMSCCFCLPTGGSRDLHVWAFNSVIIVMIPAVPCHLISLF